MRRWRAALPWVVPAIGLAALPAVVGAAFVPAAGAAASRVVAPTASVPAVARVVLPGMVVPSLGETQPLLGQPRSLLGNRTERTNWSGYDVVTGGPFTSVTATWKQPRVRSSSADFTDAAFWVGLDGDTPDPDNDPAQTVEQIGTEGFSLMGHVYYDAWYEMYVRGGGSAADPVFLNNPKKKRYYLPIHAGDWVTATVTWIPATDATNTSPATLEGFTLTLVDHTTSKTFTKTIATPKTSVPPERSSVEVVAEAPSLADGSILPIADFGLLTFRDCAFEGQPIDAFDWSRINMISWDTRATEVATSVLSPNGAAFSVTTDLKRPVTAVSGAGAAWHGKPVTLHFTARDNRGGTGVAFTQYSLDGGATWTKGKSVTLPAPADHSADGAIKVWYRSADRAGNLERRRVCTVHIDTRRPTPVAKWPARALRGHQAAVRFFVSDPRPGSPTATVTLRFRDSRGALVRKIVLSGCRVDKTLACRFVCRFAKGAYRVVVSATDSAGNIQTAAAITDLLVR